MDLARLLKNSSTAREYEVCFVALSSLGLLCVIILYAACLFQGNAPTFFLVAIAYCVPGAILFFFSASLYFARWLFLSEGGANP